MKENAMYSEIKDSRKENYGVSVALLCVAQMKEKYCFEKREYFAAIEPSRTELRATQFAFQSHMFR